MKQNCNVKILFLMIFSITSICHVQISMAAGSKTVGGVIYTLYYGTPRYGKASGSLDTITIANIASSVVYSSGATGNKSYTWTINEMRGTFKDRMYLQKVNIPSSITNIGPAFENCPKLEELEIPATVNSIGDVSTSNDVIVERYYAIKDCPNLKYVYCYRTTDYTSYKKLSSAYTQTLSHPQNYVSSNEETTVYYAADKCNVEAAGLKKRFVPGAFEVEQDTSYFSAKFSLPPYPKYPQRNVVALYIDGNTLTADKNGIYSLNGLEQDVAYLLQALVHDNSLNTDTLVSFNIYARDLDIESSLVSTTQTSIKLYVNATNESDALFESRGILYNGTEYPADEAGCVKIDGIDINTTIGCTPYAVYNGQTYYGDYCTYKTRGVGISIATKNAPTSVIITVTNNCGDAEFVKCGLQGTEYEGTGITLTGLNPSTKYSYTYYVETKNGTETKSLSFTTSDLELATLQPKVVSSACAIAAATTNISEEETNVGFQWKKYDAPDELAPNEGYSAIYDGQLEGYIKNLQATYYNVRAFYKSADDTYYYGDWVTFDQTDFSYFEPTVHTYDATDITHNSAKVRGYVMQGTDDVTGQGFEYWKSSSNSANAMVAYAPSATDNVTTVLATGQVMTATLENLQPSTAYCCRAFVTTPSGTAYGEEQTFTTTADVTGIYGVQTEAAEPTIVGYYDLQGRRLSSKVKGVNIIKYSDGTARKTFIK